MSISLKIKETQKTDIFPSIRPNPIEQKDCHGMINDEIMKFILLEQTK